MQNITAALNLTEISYFLLPVPGSSQPWPSCGNPFASQTYGRALQGRSASWSWSSRGPQPSPFHLPAGPPRSSCSPSLTNRDSTAIQQFVVAEGVVCRD
jgi:hypothetical protein